MINPLPYPANSHFGDEFALGVQQGLNGEPHPKHPRGLFRAGSYVSKGRDHGTVKAQLYSYEVPDGSDPLYPVPGVGERLYVGRWWPDEVFAGGWGFASGFSGLGDLKGEYTDATGTVQTILLADSTQLMPNADFAKFEIGAVNTENPSNSVVELFFEITAAPAAGDVLKGRLDFVS